MLLERGGTEVDTAGDGLLATFDEPLEAIRFGLAMSAADRQLGLPCRVGIHTGEIESDDRAIRGIAVVVASRIGAVAGADEVLVSSAVRELVAGSSMAFADRGLVALKGVAEPRRIFQATAVDPLATTESGERDLNEVGQ